jgi:hypothetical protein
MTTWPFPVKYTNLLTDRLFYGTATGLLMCLRELPLAQPIQHQLPAETPAEKPGEAEPMMPEPSAAPAANPFGAPQP